MPKDAAAVIVASPKKDLSDDEAVMLNDYLAKGGRALFLVDAMSTNAVILDNFNKLLHQFGIDTTNNVVVEEDPIDRHSGINRNPLMTSAGIS